MKQLILKKSQSSGKSHLVILAIGSIFVLLIVAFFYLDRHNALSALIKSLGLLGVLLAVCLMAILSMTPIPSEGLVLMYLKIYGVVWGTLLAWVGSNLGSLLIYFIVKHYGQFLLQKIISKERFEAVNQWVKRRGTFGLFIARLLPIPAFAVNYIASLIPSVDLWPYLWTQMVSIIPYYAGTALVFLGVAKETWYWLVIGGLAIVAFWSFSYLLNRKKLPN
ncbi:hypothetical protein Desor_2881 [Desulfosporosinus orientis DSM 765]|uniref:TVP38/TMEM64 family membrane protein n=1 Tax=Desulfosporosinus orientis (strain ATCC 19365 / DSM 765 / NCIMB 8382 / VKM B-1628 / Singapore I) TaxID=768706 RepID=G7WFG8_DESOD|nr:VTT domain-containing protein [Desulfosporosinus orientis]AET68411.1 hypothetical protein Desor_2881 [Desulfosporosinus orientis DSM 765]